MWKILRENKESLAKRASLLKLSAKILADRMCSGSFKSVARGQGIEFSDVREYLPGDNVRAVDWNVTARMGRPFIKQYEEDREMNVFFVVDRSSSMFSGSEGKSKLETASETAALLLLAAGQKGACVGAVFFDGKIQFSTKAKSGQQQIMMIFSKLDKPEENVEQGSVLSNALTGTSKLLKKRSLVFVISDFRTAGWKESIARLAQKHDVIAVLITDRIDRELPEIGTVPFYDMESGTVRKFPTSMKKFKEEWFKYSRRQTDSWKEFCVRHGVSPLMISTKEDPFLVLKSFFAPGGRR